MKLTTVQYDGDDRQSTVYLFQGQRTDEIQCVHQNQEESDESIIKPSHRCGNSGADPLSAFVEAFAKVYKQTQQSKDEWIRIQTQLEKDLGKDGMHYLHNFCPELARHLHHPPREDNSLSSATNDGTKQSAATSLVGSVLMHKQNTNNGGGLQETAWNRFKYVIQVLCKTIATKQRPLILSLDDLQWADNDSLDLLSTILTDRDLSYVFFIGAYRTDEVADDDHPFARQLQNITQARSITNLELQSLSLQETAVFIARVLKLLDSNGEHATAETPPQLNDDHPVVELANAIYTKTRGNIHFTVQVLEELNRKGILFFSRMTFNWEWNLDGVDLEEGLSSNIVEAIVSKIQTLPDHLQSVLKVAAYTRSNIDIDTLQKLLAMNGLLLSDKEMLALLDQAVMQGMFNNSVGSKEYRFAHDRIQQASISLIPEGAARDGYKYKLGHQLLKLVRAVDVRKNKNTEDRTWMWFAAVDHFNATQFAMNHDPLFITRINLQVGEKAMRVAAFETASNYLQNSMANLLQLQDPWKNNYQLTVRLYRIIAEVEFCQGHFEIGKGIAEQILDKAQSLKDKLPTYVSLSAALGREEEHQDALAMNRDVLLLLKAYPKRFYARHIARDLFFVKRYLAKTTDDEILALPILEDKDLERQLSLLHECSTQAIYCANMLEFLVAVLKMVKITIKHGLSSYAGVAFGKYSMFLGNLNDTKGARRVAKLTAEILETYHCKQSKSLTIFCVAHWVDGWTNTQEETLETYKRGHTAGIQVGDIESAFLNSLGAVHHAHGCGYPLHPLGIATGDILEQMRLYRVRSAGSLLEQVLLAIQTLSGQASQDLNWDALTEFKAAHAGHSEQYRLLFGFLGRCEIGVYFGNFEFAHAMAIKMWQFLPKDAAYIVVTMRIFYAGLAASGLARTTRKRKYIRIARMWANKMTSINRSKQTRSNHRELIMVADLKSACRANETSVKLHFDAAIEAAMEADHIHDAALASELLAEFYLDMVRNPQSSNRGRTKSDIALIAVKHYMSQARYLYSEWGAKAKVSQLNESRADFLDDINCRSSLFVSSDRRGTGISGPAMEFMNHSSRSHDMEVLSAMTPTHKETSEEAKARHRTTAMRVDMNNNVPEQVLESSRQNGRSVRGQKSFGDEMSVLTDLSATYKTPSNLPG